METYVVSFDKPAFFSAHFRVVLYFMDRDGDRIEVMASVGDTLLDVAVSNDVELEGTGLSYAVNHISSSFKTI